METINYFPSREQLTFLAAYNKANNAKTWIIYTQPTLSRFGGVSSEFIEFDITNDEFVVIQAANGDKHTVPFDHISVRVSHVQVTN